MAASPPPTRRRSEKSRMAIFAATREVLLERGFDGLTIEAVAARAGVGKNTIYRWWPSRPALVAEVVLEDADSLLTAVDHSDDAVADIVSWATAFTTALTTPRGYAMLRTLMAASMEHDDTFDKLRLSFSTPLHDALQSRMRAAGVARAAAQAAADALVGGLVYSILRDGCAYPVRRAKLTAKTIVTSVVPHR